ncbi:YpjP family protein [Virgibacillus chiguensis]|uniref:YpjP-like protein n=1 Tax=Virgibacillus chiguensis TaxID=411959 RepID=A0A1M5SYQ2_9BACI|nr:YpjP family protein [Virgibacillus chiguensis]SHH43641.1 YpjP-like protein [Virgibacillus chiguensis]
MKRWMKKIAVMAIAFVTLGMYVPTSLTQESVEAKPRMNSDSDVSEQSSTVVLEETPPFVDPRVALSEKAKEQVLRKMGPRISERVADEFTTVILPKIEQVMETVMLDENGEPISHYGITEDPSSGYGERIFHVYDYHKQENVVKFHVRRVHRPLEGHWFNFHYHLNTDQFETHYEIGEIFWDKNTPPKWMT